MIKTGLNWRIFKYFLHHQENVVPVALFLDVCAKDLNVQGAHIQREGSAQLAFLHKPF
jgi:hypothetical protein